MLTLLSPAKNLDETPFDRPVESTVPALFSQVKLLAKTAKTQSAEDLKSLMHISDNLAELNADRFKSFRLNGRSNTAKPASLMFNGDVYGGLDATSMSSADFAYAQDHLRILSGLYGVLRPLDAIQPHRLEMGTKLKNERGGDLYAFWGDRVTQTLNAHMDDHDHRTVLNLASNEYFKVVKKKSLKAGVITPRFLEVKDGKARVLSFYAKRARGLLARWVIQNRVDDPNGIFDFNVEDYAFDKAASETGKPVFSRKQPLPIAQRRAKS